MRERDVISWEGTLAGSGRRRLLCAVWGAASADSGLMRRLRSGPGLLGRYRVLSKDSIGRLPSGTSSSETSSAVRSLPATTGLYLTLTPGVFFLGTIHVASDV